MERRDFLKSAAAVTAVGGAFPGALAALAPDVPIDLREVNVVLPSAPSARESLAARMFLEESAKRCGLPWAMSAAANAPVTVLLGTRASWGRLPAGAHAGIAGGLGSLTADGFALRTGGSDGRRWIAVCGATERGLLFGVGALMRAILYGRQTAAVAPASLQGNSSPRTALRGHQLGYRPKTNAYDGWTVPMWEQYIRDLVVFGTNAIELLPPRTDDLPDSPNFPIPQQRMLIEMSRIADEYGLDVWVWYPAMDKDYSSPATVNAAVAEWYGVLKDMPRLDAVFVPGGDPGHTAPEYLMPMLEKQKQSIGRVHPKAQMWVAPQGFNQAWMDTFLKIIRDPHTQTWLDGIVFGPQSRLSVAEMRQAVPARYPIRHYPDITHTLSSQYPVPDWDVAYALTEGREIINPRPVDEANIQKLATPYTIGFLTYSEGCNDDVNKFVWSAVGWDPDRPISAILRDFSRYFIGADQEVGFAQGLLNLERNWRGPLLTNEQVDVTLAAFRDMESVATPFTIENWRWQQAMYRAFYDAYVRRRLIDETAALARAQDLLGRVWDIGWAPVPPAADEAPFDRPTSGIAPSILIDQAVAILDAPYLSTAAAELRTRVLELGYALLQSIHMQLAVDRYAGEAVNRGANLDTLDAPVTDIPYLRSQLQTIRRMDSQAAQIVAIKHALTRTNPGPGGFYDDLGNPSSRPHLLLGMGPAKDPEFRHSALIGYAYSDRGGALEPVAWKRWGGSMFDAPLQLRYEGLDPSRAYRVRVVYSGTTPTFKLRLVANDGIEVHPYILRTWPPAPQEFAIPAAATAGGTLLLSWTREPGLGGSGVGCQVAEVWLMLDNSRQAAAQ